MHEWSAHAAAALRDDDLGAEVLILAEHEDGSGQRLEIQKSLNPTDEDRRMGQDTYSIGDERGAVHYGGIDTWSISDEALELHLAADAAADLRVQDGYRVRLADPATHSELVDAVLRKIVGYPQTRAAPRHDEGEATSGHGRSAHG